MRSRFLRTWACLAATLLTPVAYAQAPSPAGGGAAVSAALRTLFSPRRAPAERAMGLTQRSFLDLADSSAAKLQVAFVIDGTESMGPALDAVKQSLTRLMQDLELYKDREVAYQLVVYRDAGAPSGEVVFPLKQENNAFTGDRDVLLKAIDSLTTETGAPYFPELVDQGVHDALSGLGWSADEAVSRWVFLFGDAPPFDPSLDEPETGARRRFATESIVALADAKKVRINCLLCPSRPEDDQAYQAVLDQTREFFGALSSGSGGLMLDLSYPDIREAMLQAGAAPDVDSAEVGAITRDEVERVRAELTEPASPSEGPIALAILPHAPLDQIRFASDEPSVQLATELRMRIKSAPGVTVAEPLIVEQRFERLRRGPLYSGLRGAEFLQTLGRSLRADYLLWGDIEQRGGQQRIATRVYDVSTGEVVAEANRESGPGMPATRLGALLAGDMLATSFRGEAHRPLAARLAAARSDPATSGLVMRQIVTDRAHADLMAGLASLEKALGYPAGDAAAVALLREALPRLRAAAATDDDNAYPHFLLANCLFNLAKAERSDTTQADDRMAEFGQQIRAAYRFRTSLPQQELRQEIEADYALLVRKRPGEAIPVYKQLAAASNASDSARRACWMLAGIYGGDWQVDQQFVDKDNAKQQLVRVLALWPESSEARFIKQVLRWSDEAGQTRFQHFPLENAPLAEQIDREA